MPVDDETAEFSMGRASGRIFLTSISIADDRRFERGRRVTLEGIMDEPSLRTEARTPLRPDRTTARQIANHRAMTFPEAVEAYGLQLHTGIAHTGTIHDEPYDPPRNTPQENEMADLLEEDIDNFGWSDSHEQVFNEEAEQELEEWDKIFKAPKKSRVEKHG